MLRFADLLSQIPFLLVAFDSILLWYLILVIFKSIAGDPKDSAFLKKSLRGVRTVICPNVRLSTIQGFLRFYFSIRAFMQLNVVHDFLQEGFLSKVDSLKGVQHVIILSQVVVYLFVNGVFFCTIRICNTGHVYLMLWFDNSAVVCL